MKTPPSSVDFQLPQWGCVGIKWNGPFPAHVRLKLITLLKCTGKSLKFEANYGNIIYSYLPVRPKPLSLRTLQGRNAGILLYFSFSIYIDYDNSGVLLGRVKD